MVRAALLLMLAASAACFASVQSGDVKRRSGASLSFSFACRKRIGSQYSDDAWIGEFGVAATCPKISQRAMQRARI